MNLKRRYTCVVPARKGSRSIKNKNLQKIGDTSLVGYAINLALSSKFKVILTTDIEELVDNYKSFEIEIRKRPKHLATDSATMEDVILDVIKSYSLEDQEIILLQPTSPFRTCEQLHSMIDLYQKSYCSLLLSVTEIDANVLKCFIKSEEFEPINKKKYLFSNRQELPQVFKPNGAFYIFNGQSFLEKGFDVSNIKTFVMDACTSLDIDTTEDLNKARKIIKSNK